MPELRAEVLTALHDMFLMHNRLSVMFKSAVDSLSRIDPATIETVGFTWSASDELANFEVGSIVEHPGYARDIRVTATSGRIHRISDGHQLYHAVTYPLLFPTGQSGWHYNMQHNDRSISLTEYMRYCLMHRGHPSHVQCCERLSLEYYCDAWAQVEARNLAFHKLASQQAKYSAASARTIIDQLCSDNAQQIGVPVVLPASYPNSPRYYHNLYLDAVALPRRFGKPDLFITITANPQWPEITRALPPRSHWTHHPDIVARVFSLKLNAILDFIVDKKLFGEVTAMFPVWIISCISPFILPECRQVLAYVHRIEWQVICTVE
jgi:hypothetical protein